MMSIAGLVKSGLPLSFIETLDDAEMLAWTVAFGKLEGGSFDWEELKWRQKE